MKNLLFNHRFVYLDAAPSEQPEAVPEAPKEQEKPASLEELQTALAEGRKEIYAHFRMMENMAKENPATANVLKNMMEKSEYYQDYLKDKSKKQEAISGKGILPYITTPEEKKG